MGVRIEVEGLAELRRILKVAEKKVGDLRPPFKLIRAKMIASIRRNFIAEGRPKSWIPSLRRADPSHKHSNRPTLRVEGALMNATSGRVTKDARGTNLTLRNNLRYAAAQQFGTLTIGGHLPARPFIVFQRDDIMFARRVIGKFIAKILSKK